MSDNNFIIFGKPSIGDDEIAEVTDSLKSGWIGTGPKVKQFESDFAAYQGVSEDQVAAVNSCTAALHLSLIAAGIGPGDEVITTSMTFCASVNAIIHSGATPILADIDSQTFNISHQEIAKKITSKTKAVLIVHFAGRPCNMDEIASITQRNNLVLIEDCAHAIESKYRNKPTGTFGDFGCYSFYATKNMTTAEGGMVIAKEKSLIKKIKTLSLHGMSQDAWHRFGDNGYKHYLVKESGFKYNLTDLCASLGIHQLKKIDTMWAQRQKIWDTYMSELKNLAIILPQEPEQNSSHSYHLFTLQMSSACAIKDRDLALEKFTSLGIGVGVHYLAIPEHPYYQRKYGIKPADTPNAMKFGRRTISIPLSPSLSQNQIERIISAVKVVSNRA